MPLGFPEAANLVFITCPTFCVYCITSGPLRKEGAFFSSRFLTSCRNPPVWTEPTVMLTFDCQKAEGKNAFLPSGGCDPQKLRKLLSGLLLTKAQGADRKMGDVILSCWASFLTYLSLAGTHASAALSPGTKMALSSPFLCHARLVCLPSTPVHEGGQEQKVWNTLGWPITWMVTSGSQNDHYQFILKMIFLAWPQKNAWRYFNGSGK